MRLVKTTLAKGLRLNIIVYCALLMLSGCSGLSSLSEQSLFVEGSGATSTISDSRAVKVELDKALYAVKKGDVEAADKAFKAMLAQGAKSPVSLNHYAIYLREQWRMDEAEKIYLLALANSPNDSMTHWNLAIFYELYRGDYQQALVHYQNYQQHAKLPDKRVKHWIVDLTRRIKQES